jgi:hypothetical protein
LKSHAEQSLATFPTLAMTAPANFLSDNCVNACSVKNMLTQDPIALAPRRSRKKSDKTNPPAKTAVRLARKPRRQSSGLVLDFGGRKSQPRVAGVGTPPPEELALDARARDLQIRKPHPSSINFKRRLDRPNLPEDTTPARNILPETDSWDRVLHHESRKTSMVAHLRILFKDDSTEPPLRVDSRLRKFAKALFYCRASWRLRPSGHSIAPYVMDYDPDQASAHPPSLRLFVGKASPATLSDEGQEPEPNIRVWHGDSQSPNTPETAPGDDTGLRPNPDAPRRLRLVRHSSHQVVRGMTRHKSKDRITGR